ncbi:hypothetical protein ACIPVB_14070 [Microbacterium sp. NPDC090007]|uniref:hypothetical protein n=1 Tax=Microbacterium sp. NPDC090007 TaxID=3364204 RepID=UPI00382F7340
MAGEILVLAASLDGRLVSPDLHALSNWSLASFFALFCVLRMATRRCSLQAVAVAFAFGRLAALTQTGFNMSNVWKYNLALPVAILLLAVMYSVHAKRRLIATGLLLAALAVISVAFDYRSLAAMCALAGLLIVVSQAGSARAARRNGSHDIVYAVIIVLALLVINQIGTDAALNGLLGNEIQARSVYQFDATGSLLSGARPEWFATFALMGQHIWGFGPGVSAGWNELGYAFAALDNVGIGSSNPYVQVYMFGSGVELHSIIADLWARYGVVGLAFAVLVTLTLTRSLISNLRRSITTGMTALLSVWAIWSMLFGPIYTDSPLIVLALVLCASATPSKLVGTRT